MKILIVDDDTAMVELLSKYLEPISSRIDSAHDLAEGLEKARTGVFNIVLLDLRLKLTGKEEAFESIKEFKKYGPAVVVVSGIPEPDIKEQALAAGADVFIPKDSSLNDRAIMVATYVATLSLPKASYRSESYREHVELLRRIAEEDPAATKDTP